MGMLFLAPVPWVGSRVWGWDLLLLMGTSQAKISLLFLNPHTVGVGHARSTSLPLLPVFTRLLLYILSYRTSV